MSPVKNYSSTIVFCEGTQTIVQNIINPKTGKTWMDRNLGASRAAISITDSLAYGDLYQWGRASDGHQCRKSENFNYLSSNEHPNHDKFILAINGNFDWLSSQNDSLWQGVNGMNNPCPSGYRIPTSIEIDAEIATWSENNITGAFNSVLKIPMPGHRSNYDGSLNEVGRNANYWSSSLNGTFASDLNFDLGNARISGENRAYGFSVRCIKN